MRCPRCDATVKEGIKFCPVCGGGLPSWTGRLKAGDLLSERYRVERPLARGGMGAVYLALDTRLGDAPVALKEMTLHHAPGDTEAWTRAVAEFRREATLLARLSHPNLPHVIDQFEANGNQFLVMELIAGRTLRAELESRTAAVPFDEALEWFKQVSSVLGYLHNQPQPIIYRDLKPANIMLRSDGRIVLIDFGIARLYKPDQTGDTSIYGTPGYSPPEQYGLGQTDARSDVYSLAMVMHEVLTGHDPVRRKNARPALVHATRADVPDYVGLALNRALALEPDDRFASIAALSEALRAPAVVAAGTSPQSSGAAASATLQPAVAAPVLPGVEVVPPSSAARRWWLWLGAAVLVALVGVATALGLSRFAAVPAAPTAQPSVMVIIAPTALPPTPTPLPPPPAPPGMVAVPAGEFIMGSEDATADERPMGPGYLPLFYLDRTEVTNADYQGCVAQGRCTAPIKLASATHTSYYTNTFYAAYPVVNIDLTQARSYCEAQSKRLPTEAEWEKAARGPKGLIYPWGNTWDSSLVNAWGDGDGGDTQPVGAYPGGASSYGALDMVGNVWEWTSSLDVPYPYNASDGREVPNAQGLRVIRGGSWGRDARNARTADRDRRAPTEFNDNLGLRCATSQPFQPAGMDYIPGGAWTMGASAEQLTTWQGEFGWTGLTNEQPTTVISTSAFYLDRTEVTNARYLEFITVTNHPLPLNTFDPVGLAAWNPDGSVPLSLTDHPVVNVTWRDAVAYCAWRGKRLPSEAEWERAAKGAGQSTWPWGDQWSPDNANIAESGLLTTRPVGTQPGGAGPYGTLDLAGNVWEWTSTINQRYPYDPADGREAPAGDNPRVLRGGSWKDDRRAVHSSGRNSLRITIANNNVGFRCALDMPK